MCLMPVCDLNIMPVLEKMEVGIQIQGIESTFFAFVLLGGQYSDKLFFDLISIFVFSYQDDRLTPLRFKK